MNAGAIQLKLAQEKGLLPGNRSLFLKPRGKPKAHVLLLHGFSASPWEVAEYARHLRKKGCLVYAPRLAGHGAGSAEFNAHGRADWLADAEAAFAALVPAKGKLALVGHSGGGALAALLADRHAGQVSCLVLAAPAFRLRDRMAPFSLLRVVRFFRPELHFEPVHPDSQYWTLDYRSDRIAELVRLGREAKAVLPRLGLPLLMVQASGDELVSAGTNLALFEKIPEGAKTLFTYETNEHNVLHHYNPIQAKVFGLVDGFLKRHAF